MISIATKLRPFSHTHGAKCLLPGTSTVIEAFPHLLRIGSEEIPIQIEGGFTLQMDLDRNCVWVFGKNFRKKIEGIAFPNIEKLSLGSHKSPDWDLVLRRMDMAEILPILFDLGQKTAEEIAISIHNYTDFYREFFHDIAVPRGPYLKQAYKKIRSHFILENDQEIVLLPDNPFPHGRLMNLQTNYGSFDLEWTKKNIRRAVFHPTSSGVIRFPHRYRKKMHLHEKGNVFSDTLAFEAGKRLYLDRFLNV
jgi:hypothetical protein